MPFVQAGPPQWVWERTPDPLKWEVLAAKAPEGHTVYELKVSCGLAILRLQFFTPEELTSLVSTLQEAAHAHERRAAEPVASRNPGVGVVSDPDF
jgi:hypothetical protein